MPRIDPLNAGAIRAHLAALGETLSVEVRERCGSTNTELLERPGIDAPFLLLAEEQTAGRGRRGRRWHAPPGSALMFTLRWQFSGSVARLRGLSLAVGVSVARSLRALGAGSVALKWPNDLLAPLASGDAIVHAKLGGVLVETQSLANGVAAMIGVGVNCRRVPGLEAQLKRRVAALEELVYPLPARNAIAARLTAELARTLRAFDAGGFAAFRDEWDALHIYRGEQLRVRTAQGRVIAGVAQAIAADGALPLRNRRGLRLITSGTVMRASVACAGAV
ncbi:MAG: biotin--[acetyl-CoA-carboxylase] ligase [Betaproteobacteria bacterium]|nr:biotin--[acetyl-CoA-carboxylase] ligase [Betaproteobacteria bacterium]